MPTTPEKPGKPRPRSRKASEQKKAKAGAKAQVLRDQVLRDQAHPDQVTLDAAEPARPVIARVADVPADVTPAETAPIELTAAEGVSDVAPLEGVPVDVAPETAPVAVALEEAQQETEEKKVQEEKEEQMAELAPLNGEVLPPEVRDPAPAVASLVAIAQAYGEYTRKSWLNGRSLVERLIAMRSFDEAIEIQGEFAQQAYTNFIVQSEKICVLYGGWAQQSFRPFEKFAAGWSRIGR